MDIWHMSWTELVQKQNENVYQITPTAIDLFSSKLTITIGT